MMKSATSIITPKLKSIVSAFTHHINSRMNRNGHIIMVLILALPCPRFNVFGIPFYTSFVGRWFFCISVSLHCALCFHHSHFLLLPRQCDHNSTDYRLNIISVRDERRRQRDTNVLLSVRECNPNHSKHIPRITNGMNKYKWMHVIKNIFF